ncbi:HAD-like domain-containing protein [Annulohypoxylon moriforme]|nr:HAD-like domain-containing protein [Annulohypoxylon moriforme]
MAAHLVKHFSEMLGVDVQIIQRSLDQGQQSLKVNTHMAQLVEALKASDENLQLIVMSNISREHFRCVQGIDLPWSLFNFIFASGIVGMKKPDLCFFQHVLDKIGIPPDQVVMVDDRVENITAARSMGIHGILVNSHSPIETVQVLKNMFFDPTSGTETCMENNTWCCCDTELILFICVCGKDIRNSIIE